MVVDESTICLMGHERKLVLDLIIKTAKKVMLTLSGHFRLLTSGFQTLASLLQKEGYKVDMPVDVQTTSTISNGGIGGHHGHHGSLPVITSGFQNRKKKKSKSKKSKSRKTIQSYPIVTYSQIEPTYPPW